MPLLRRQGKRNREIWISDAPDQLDPANGISVTITSDFNFSMFNRSIIKREIGELLRTKVLLEDLLLLLRQVNK